MKIPKAIQNLIESFERLPGVGPKSAQRLTFYLLHVPQSELDKFASAVSSLKKDTVLCSTCFTVGETDPCVICSDSTRDHSIICVVEQPLDVLALEKNGKYRGVYHVLHGKIDPLNNIGPDEIYINQLLVRAEKNSISEVILATNPTMEGEGTAMYIAKQFKILASLSASDRPSRDGGRSGQNSPASTSEAGRVKFKITRIGRGLPTGADLEYADELTLQRAMEGRSEY